MRAPSGLSLVYTTVQAHWGYIVRQPGATAAQTAYVLPPPPTVVGAFAASLGRLLGMPDALPRRPRRPVLHPLMECALNATVAAGAGLLAGGVALVEEPSRLIGAPFKGGGALQRALKSPIVQAAGDLLPVQAVGAASGPGALLVLAWAVRLGDLEKCAERSISDSLLERAAASVYRLGSREGLVAPVPEGVRGSLGSGVLTDDLEVLGGGARFESILYQPASCAEPASGYAARIVMLDETYRESEYLVPSGPGGGPGQVLAPPRPVLFTVRHGACAAIAPGRELPLGVAFPSGVVG